MVTTRTISKVPAAIRPTLPEEVELTLLLPEQYARARIRRDGGSRRLMAALIGDAVHCFTRYAFCGTTHGHRLFDEASRWIMEPGAPSSVSFESACDALDIDMGALRERLRRWHEQRRGRYAA